MKPTQILVFLAGAAAVYTALALGRAAFEDQADREFWNNLSGAGEEVAEMRHEEAQTLAGGNLPIERAIAAYGVKGRAGFDLLKVNGGQKLAPIAGWVHHPEFNERAAAAKAFTEQQAAAEEATGEDEAEADEEATEAPAAAPAKPAAAKPAKPAAPAKPAPAKAAKPAAPAAAAE